MVVLGHIDHGKTSLLNAIRQLQFTGEKPGGFITQHIGAYQIEKEGRKITFIDTPGHEAFSQMRSRGAKVADVAILVVDSGEGVKEQTKEAISHIKKAEIPLIVALNKIDKPGANPDKVKGELAKEDVLVESLGGKIPSVEVSAKTGKGIEDLLDLILLVAEMENLKSDLQKTGQGIVIESYLDNQRGPTATLILAQGILKAGDVLGTPSTFGKVKGLENSQGFSIEKALPSDPVVVTGLENAPKVGDIFEVFPDLESAKAHLKAPAKKEPLKVLETDSEQKILNLILKTDVLGSLEAIEDVLKAIPQEKIILQILKSAVGEINEEDIKVAKAHPVGGYPALVLGFRVKINPIAKILAEREKVRIMQFEVIYDLVEGVRQFMEKIMKPETIRVELGKVRVLAKFLAEKNRQIIGGKVTEGEAVKGASIEVLRNEEPFGEGRLINLQRNKKDIERLTKGEECGILYEGDNKIEEGDVLVLYIEEKRRGEL